MSRRRQEVLASNRAVTGSDTEANRVEPINDDIEWARKDILDRFTSRVLHRDYYQGKHAKLIDHRRLDTLFGKVFQNFSLNYCKKVVNALSNRLQIDAFTSPEEEKHKREIERMIRELEKQPFGPAAQAGWAPGMTLTDLQKMKQATEAPPNAGGQQRTTDSSQAAGGRATGAATANQSTNGSTTDSQGVSPGGTQPSTPDVDLRSIQQKIDQQRQEAANRQQQIDELNQQLELVPTASQEAERIWNRNRMARRMGQIHQEAIATGDAFIVVWADDEGFPILHPQKAEEMAVSYKGDKPGVIEKAAKMWREDIDMGDGTGSRPYYRCTLYYEDRIEKYAAPISKGKNVQIPKANLFEKYKPEEDPAWPLPNPYGKVPVFHFANDADISEYGTSELKDAVSVQNALNRSVFQILVGGETAIFPQRYLLNIQDPREGEEKLQIGPDTIWRLLGATDDGSNAQVGQFAGADMAQLTNTASFWAQQMAVTTETPIHHFLPTLGGPATPASGESQKTNDMELQFKVEDRQISFGDAWEACMSFAVQVLRQEIGGIGPTNEEPLEQQIDLEAVQEPIPPNEQVIPGERPEEDMDVTLEAQWRDMRPRNEVEEVNNNVNKVKGLGLPWQQALKELGYSDDEIDSFEVIKQKNAAAFNQLPVGGAMGPGGDKDINAIVDDFAQATGIDQ